MKPKLIFKIFGVQDGNIFAAPINFQQMIIAGCKSQQEKTATLIGVFRKEKK